MPHQAVLFDLDGTLADTAPDMAAALNALLQEEGRAPLPFARIRPRVSHGGRALIELGFGLGEDAPEYPRLRERFLALYRDMLANETRLFAGMPELLDALEARGLGWGVVTNKPGWLTAPVMAALGLARRAGCIVSGDTTPHAKPHPEPLLHASRTLAVAPGACLYVGDAERDIEAGRAAGMATLVARFGYLGEDDRPEQWGADGQIELPGEVLDWVGGSA
ncbi:MAG TPA: phosphoglycolate phosphatase [Gammaproteobacteria bacterium]